jgi:hypothetical protein
VKFISAIVYEMLKLIYLSVMPMVTNVMLLLLFEIFYTNTAPSDIRSHATGTLKTTEKYDGNLYYNTIKKHITIIMYPPIVTGQLTNKKI